MHIISTVVKTKEKNDQRPPRHRQAASQRLSNRSKCQRTHLSSKVPRSGLTLYPSHKNVDQMPQLRFSRPLSFCFPPSCTALPSSTPPSPPSPTAAGDCLYPIPSLPHTLPQGKVCSVKTGNGLREEADEPLGLLLVSDFRHIMS